MVRPHSHWQKQLRKRMARLDFPLLTALLILLAIGMFVLYSASGESPVQMRHQGMHLMIACGLLLFLSQVPIETLKTWSIWIFVAAVIMLVLVLLIGHKGKGAMRWLDLGFFKFQPSELMKLAMPMMVARYFADKPLPARFSHIMTALVLILLPIGLILKQPDLGTSLLVAASGLFVIYFAGLNWRILIIGGLVLVVSVSFVLTTVATWEKEVNPTWLENTLHLKPYQIRRIKTLVDPTSDPLGAGYHIIQSEIAIGSGGIYGKGWLQGDQSRLEFLPERHTDFIFAVFSEELGLVSNIALLMLYLFIIWRGLYIANRAQDSFSRLLGGSLSLTFFIYLFINTAMVTGMLPVVGVPLPLISYGGTSMVTLMAGFGILMALRGKRRLMDGNFSTLS